MGSQQKILVCGAGGFIGNHLVSRLKLLGHTVVGADVKLPQYSKSLADEFIIGDLRQQGFCASVFTEKYFQVYQLAADMGGAGYIFTGDNDADVMFNSAQINLNVLNACRAVRPQRIFFSSSACIYPTQNQTDPNNPLCAEDSAYPANPDSEYGWEKLFSERLYLNFARNFNLPVTVARFHNIYGPENEWQGGKEKAPAALCRKVALAKDGEQIEIWGDGKQTRSFLYIDECLTAVLKCMEARIAGPINIGSEEMISINALAQMIIAISGKKLSIKNINGPTGVQGRNSDNRLIAQQLNWQPDFPLIKGMEKTYRWVMEQTEKNKASGG